MEMQPEPSANRDNSAWESTKKESLRIRLPIVDMAPADITVDMATTGNNLLSPAQRIKVPYPNPNPNPNLTLSPAHRIKVIPSEILSTLIRIS